MNQIIEIDNIVDGMVLADDLVNSIGQIVLPSGSVLNPEHKQSLKRLNIRSVKIVGQKTEIDTEVITAMKAKILDEMDWKPRNDHERDLLEAVSLFRAYKNETDRENNI